MKFFYSKSVPFLLLLSCLLSMKGRSQTPTTPGSAEILLDLKKLNTLASVLYVAAHPDDENTRLLTYLSKEKLYRTGYLSITRGDGGQNLIGDEQGVELGLIRTQELLAARRIDGAEQFFTRAYDFGFSKTTDEALRIWDREKVLYDVVWVIRKFQPDVIITRFPEDSRAGHGHHSGSAVLAHEAFKAAGDPSRFPEQFKLGVKPWKAKRIVWNSFNFGNTNTTSASQFNFDIGVYNALLGKSYGEIAADSRSQHKSQGFGVPRSRGQALEYFSLVEGESFTTDLLEGVQTSWHRVKDGEKIQRQVDQLLAAYSVVNPEKSLPGLVNLYQQISGISDDYWKNQKLKEIQRLIEWCAGLWLEATANSPYAIQNDSFRFSFVANSRLAEGIILKKISIEGFDTLYRQTLLPNRNVSLTKSMLIPAAKAITQPYWLAEEMNEGSFNVQDPTLIGKAESDPAFRAEFTVTIGGVDFKFFRNVQYKFTDPVKGEIYNPITVLPAATGRFEPAVVLLNSEKDKAFDVVTRTQNRNLNSGKPILQTPSNVAINLTTNSNSIYTYQVKRLTAETQTRSSKLSFNSGGKTQPAYELRTISYDHIPRLDYFHVPALKLVTADIKIAGRRVAYIEGAGDKVPDALLQMGYDVVLLKEKDITTTMLASFDAVITGIRAYNVHEFLGDKYEVLMNYVKEGGNLVVQYNTSNFISSVKSRIGPYPFTITRNRVTEETAKVDFLDPSHPVLNYPNKITPGDFENWVQERGIYFAGDLDPKYQAILSMKDTGEQEQKGSLIIAEYGRGKFVYTGLVFFRQLPAGVPGAYRLLANIIALNKKQGF